MHRAVDRAGKMSAAAVCFLVEPIMMRRLYSRRYQGSSSEKCPASSWICDAMVPMRDEPFEWHARADGHSADAKCYPDTPPVKEFSGDSRWPTKCASCGHPFQPGAMWFDEDGGRHWAGVFNSGLGPDGKLLVVRLPNGEDWTPDRRASNCTLPNDHAHRCWVRHGSPPLITVDKNGLTCKAGAGSIVGKNWHGFLRKGILAP